jgi:apolipoprotein N-acyltransferase
MYAVAIIMGLAVCLATYFAIHHKRSVGLVWLGYAVLFWLLHTHMPWPGGSMGSMAVLSVTLWILAAKLINRQQHPHPHA